MSPERHDPARDPLVPYAEALRLVLDNVRPLAPETVPLDDALGAFLAAPALAPEDSPRFAQSAMDGYAVRMADVAGAEPDHPVLLRLTGALPAGDARELTLAPGCTVKVYTGSRLPDGTEAVVIQEHVTLRGDQAAVGGPVRPRDHIRQVGEEFRRGDEILPAGTRVTPPVVGMLVLLGRADVEVFRRPTVAVITMGDELVAAGMAPGPGRIHDANGPAVCAALRALGVRRTTHVRLRDDPVALREATVAALAASDLVITVGGASVGDHDHVPQVRAELGLHEMFRRVAIKPGKPSWFGLDAAGVPVFGLPGNTVSALVAFRQLVRPAVLRMMGARGTSAPALPVKLLRSAAHAPGRLEWLRARLGAADDGVLTAEPETGQGSHMLSALARADLLVELPADCPGAQAGDIVSAHDLTWFD